MITVACEACGKIHHVKDELNGKTARCPCGSKFQIQGVPEDVAGGSSFATPPSRQADIAPPATADTKTCPFCAETIAAAAKKCRHCGEFLDGSMRATAASVGAPSRVMAETVSPNECVLPHPKDEAFRRAAAAMRSLGTITSENASVGTLDGHVAFGLQKVKAHVSLGPAGEGRTIVTFQGKSDDVWGAAAKSAAKRYFETLRNLDSPGYQANRRGMPTAMIIVIVVILAFVVFAIIGAIN